MGAASKPKARRNHALPRDMLPDRENIAHFFAHLRLAQQEGLALWVYGTILAQSGNQNAVLTALAADDPGSWHNRRQHLREWPYDDTDKCAPCATQVDVEACFAALLAWVLS